MAHALSHRLHVTPPLEVPLPNTIFRITIRCKHLGNCTTIATSLSHEAHHRAAKVRQASPKVLRGLTTSQRPSVLNALVASRLLYETGTWPPLPSSQLTLVVMEVQKAQARQQNMIVARDIQHDEDMDTIQELMQGAQADLEAKRSKTNVGAAWSGGTGRTGARSVGESEHGFKRAFAPGARTRCFAAFAPGPPVEDKDVRTRLVRLPDKVHRDHMVGIYRILSRRYIPVEERSNVYHAIGSGRRGEAADRLGRAVARAALLGFRGLSAL